MRVLILTIAIIASAAAYAPSYQPGYQSGGVYGYQPGGTSGYQQGDVYGFQPGSLSGYQPGSLSGYQQDYPSSHQQDSLSGYQPNYSNNFHSSPQANNFFQSNPQPGYQPGYSPQYDPSASMNTLSQSGLNSQEAYYMQNPQPSINYQSQAQHNNQPVTSHEAAVIDSKLSTIQSAVRLILEARARNPHPEAVWDPKIQHMYRMMRPIVQAADQVEQQFNQNDQEMYDRPMAPPYYA